MPQINELTEKTIPVQADELHIGDSASSNDSRKCTLANLMAGRVPSFTVAALGALTASDYTGGIAFATDGRKNGEGAGLGTGVLTYCDGSSWLRASDDSTLAS